MKVWTTKDGKQIPYDKLAISHIWRIINCAKRGAFCTKYVSHSIVDNTDTCIIRRDCNDEILKEMYSELTRRKYETSKTS